MLVKGKRTRNGARWFLLAVVLGGAPLITAASCDPVSGNLQFFRDDDFGDFRDDGFFDDHHGGGGLFFDFYEEDVFIDDYYYDDYYYDDCFDCFY